MADGKPSEGGEANSSQGAAAPQAASESGVSRAAAYRNRRKKIALAKQRGPFVKFTASEPELPDRVRSLALRLLGTQCDELFLPVHVLLEYRTYVDELLLELQKEGNERLWVPQADLDDAVKDTRWWHLDKVETWLKPQVVQYCQPIVGRLQQESRSPLLYNPFIIGESANGLSPVRRFVEVSTASLKGRRPAQEDCVMTCSHWGNYFGGPARHARMESDERQLHPVVNSSVARGSNASDRSGCSPGRSGSSSPRGRGKNKKLRSTSPVSLASSGALDKWKRSGQYFVLVADGHGGTEAAAFTRDLLLPHLLRSEHFGLDFAAAWREAFKVTHASFITRAEQVDCEAGTTLLCALIWGTQLHYAWAGDSEAYLYRQGQAPIMLSRPHTPADALERKAVEDRGGIVRPIGGALRVDGRTGVTRAIGGKETAEHLSHEPETGSLEITAEDEFLVLATDGVWDKFSGQEVYDFVAAEKAEIDARVRRRCERLRSGRESLAEPEAAAEEGEKVRWDYGEIACNLCAKAIEKGSSDNCSAAVCFFHQTPPDMSGATERAGRSGSMSRGAKATSSAPRSRRSSDDLSTAQSCGGTPQSPVLGAPPHLNSQSRVADMRRIYGTSPGSPRIR